MEFLNQLTLQNLLVTGVILANKINSHWVEMRSLLICEIIDTLLNSVDNEMSFNSSLDLFKRVLLFMYGMLYSQAEEKVFVFFSNWTHLNPVCCE